MPTFDQREQKVKGDQVNIAGDQYNSALGKNQNSLNNLEDLVEALEKIQEQISSAKAENNIPGDMATDINYSLQKAIDQAQNDLPKKNLLLDNLEKAKTLVTGLASIGGVTIAIGKIIDAAKVIL